MRLVTQHGATITSAVRERLLNEGGLAELVRDNNYGSAEESEDDQSEPVRPLVVSGAGAQKANGVFDPVTPDALPAGASV